jgi:hypothetical protein
MGKEARSNHHAAATVVATKSASDARAISHFRFMMTGDP